MQLLPMKFLSSFKYRLLAMQQRHDKTTPTFHKGSNVREVILNAASRTQTQHVAAQYYTGYI